MGRNRKIKSLIRPGVHLQGAIIDKTKSRLVEADARQLISLNQRVVKIS